MYRVTVRLKRSITRCVPITTVLSLLTGVAFADPNTLRVDYFHTGNAESEIFSIDQVVLEPLRFAGNMDQPVDRTLRGKYAFEIVDPDTGDVAWSRSYSSIYGEWETTGEAREMNRTFHESVRFPNQDSPFELVIRKRNATNQFEEVWRIGIDPTDYLVHRESAAWKSQGRAASGWRAAR